MGAVAAGEPGIWGWHAVAMLTVAMGTVVLPAANGSRRDTHDVRRTRQVFAVSCTRPQTASWVLMPPACSPQTLQVFPMRTCSIQSRHPGRNRSLLLCLKPSWSLTPWLPVRPSWLRTGPGCRLSWMSCWASRRTGSGRGKRIVRSRRQT